MRIVEFLGEKCTIVEHHYFNSRLALELLTVDGEPMCMATINLPNDPLPEGFVFIKNYSENTGVLDKLIEAGIVEPPTHYVQSGFVSIPCCKYIPEE